MCKDILTVAGPEVENELRAGEREKQARHFGATQVEQLFTYVVFVVLCVAKVKKGEIFVFRSGSFPCNTILHVCGEKDAGIVEQLVCDIIRHCENYGFMSVAIPAICAGTYFVRPSRCAIDKKQKPKHSANISFVV